MWKRMTAVCVGLALTGSLACVDMDTEDGPDDVDDTSINLITSIDDKSDVEKMRYTITPVPCPSGKSGMPENPNDTTPIVVEKKFKELQLPGGIPTFENAPFDIGSEHIFADYLALVDAGCYDVKVQPITKKGAPSKDCQSASQKGVKVYNGKTTEILLVSQCKGQERGLLDTIAALNHPPHFIDFKIYPNKFVQCPKYGEPVKVKVCARAEDPEGDPMIMDWSKRMGPEIDHVEIVHSFQKKGVLTECVKAKLPPVGKNDDEYRFKVSVFDQFYDEDDNLITVEKWFKKNFGKTVKSRASLEFPIHLSCEAPPKKKAYCPVNKNVWKSYNKYAPMPKDIAWPTSYYTANPAEGSKLCGMTWKQRLSQDAGDDVFDNLAQQYIAALLNKANGAYVPVAAAAALFAAPVIIGHCSVNFLTRPAAKLLTITLKKYNEGLLPSPKCKAYPPGSNDLE